MYFFSFIFIGRKKFNADWPQSGLFGICFLGGALLREEKGG
jgi:hypothetical protein